MVISLEYQNIKTFLQKAIFQTDLTKFLRLKKFNNTGPWTYIVSDLKGEEIVGAFYEKELQKAKLKRV